MKFRARITMPKIGIKSALFGYFWARLFEKSLAMFEISKLECVKNGFLTHLVNFGPLFLKIQVSVHFVCPMEI